MTKKDLQKIAEETTITPTEWDNVFLKRCVEAAEAGRNYEIFAIHEIYKGQFFTEERLIDFAKSHGLTAEKNKIVLSGSTVVISWEKEGESL